MRNSTKLALFAAVATLLAGVAFLAAQTAGPAPAADPVVAEFDRATIASVADAVDQIVGKRGFMAHDMRPVTGARFAGRAATALLEPASADKAGPKVSAKHSVEMIDNAKPGEVGIIVIKEGLDVAGMGGLMGTAAKARQMAGLVLDSSVRDVAELRALGLNVFARGIIPSSTVSRYASVARNVPVVCAGVEVKPGDIVVAGEDGVVVVPRDKEKEVLARSKEIDERETKMVPHILEQKSLSKVVEMFNRI